LEVHTSFGVVRDIGTQFEVRVSDSSLRVRVRSGVVEVRRGPRGDEVSSARPGTELTVGPTGASSRAVMAYGPEWAWAASLAPAFEIEGRTLGAFLEHLCREQGWTLAYADPQLTRAASGIILHGPTTGLQPSEALAVVLATTGLTHRLRDGELLVARDSQSR
jgi:ferric-dicitrate binding protein FerR (iron transport regulator)